MATKNKPAAPKSDAKVESKVEDKSNDTGAYVLQIEEKAAKPAAPYKKLTQFQLPDGTIVNTQKEATEWSRRHMVVEALEKVCDGNKETAAWLLENKAAILAAFAAAEVKREISDETREKMRKALLERRAAGKI